VKCACTPPHRRAIPIKNYLFLNIKRKKNYENKIIFYVFLGRAKRYLFFASIYIYAFLCKVYWRVLMYIMNLFGAYRGVLGYSLQAHSE